MNREAIYSALFEKIKAIEGLVTVSRILKHWNDVTPSQQPALFMTQDGELPTSRQGLPTTWHLIVSLYLYCNAGSGSEVIPTRQVNEFLDKIQAVVAPDRITGVQDLGGLVRGVKFGEKIETDEGLLGAQSVAIIPVIITLEE